MAEGFVLGSGLLSDVRRVIARVDGESPTSGFRRIPTVLEDDNSRQQKVFRICTFTGAWPIGATKTVTFKYQTATPNTVVATNLFFPFPAVTNATDCAIAKDGTAWHLIDVPFQTATAVFVSAIATQAVVSNVQIAAVLNTLNCAITVSRTQTTASVSIVSSTFTSTFIRFKVT